MVGEINNTAHNIIAISAIILILISSISAIASISLYMLDNKKSKIRKNTETQLMKELKNTTNELKDLVNLFDIPVITAQQKSNKINTNNGLVKIFLSHNMSGLTDSEVEEIREKAKADIEEIYGEQSKNFIYIDNYHHDDAPENATRLWHLGRSIQQLGEADAVWFCKGASYAKGCIIERIVVAVYGIKCL